jgi:hypothetical protein
VIDGLWRDHGRTTSIAGYHPSASISSTASHSVCTAGSTSSALSRVPSTT